MPAPNLCPTPAEQMRTLLIEARRSGIPFSRAWDYAMGTDLPHVLTRHREDLVDDRIAFPRDTFDRQVAMHALKATRSAWESAYYADPPLRAMRAVTLWPRSCPRCWPPRHPSTCACRGRRAAGSLASRRSWKCWTART